MVQTGDPEGPAEGFIDPSTEKTRTIPLEITVNGEKAPVYGATLEVIFSCLWLLGHVYFCAFLSKTSLYDQKK